MKQIISECLFAIAFMAIGGLFVATGLIPLVMNEPPKTRKECLARGYEDVICYASFKEKK